MLSRRDDASVALFVGIVKAVELSGRSAEFYADAAIPSGDPWPPVDQALSAMIDGAALCLQRHTCSATDFGRLVHLAAACDAMGRRAETSHALSKAGEVLQDLLGTRNVALADSETLAADFARLSAASEECRAAVGDWVRRMVARFAAQGAQAQEEMARLADAVRGILHVQPAFPLPSVDPYR